MTQKLGDLLNSPQYLGSVCTGQYVLSDGAALPGPYFASQETNAWSIIAQGCKDNFCENIEVGRRIRREGSRASEDKLCDTGFDNNKDDFEI